MNTTKNNWERFLKKYFAFWKRAALPRSRYGPGCIQCALTPRPNRLAIRGSLLELRNRLTIGPFQMRKMVACSSGSFAAIGGEPGRLAPQLVAASPGTKSTRCGCQCLASALRYWCFDVLYAIAPGLRAGRSFLSSAASMACTISVFDLPASTSLVFIR